MRRIQEIVTNGVVTFAIFDEAGWLPGSFESRAAAELAFCLPQPRERLRHLQHDANALAGGAGGVIRLAALRSALAVEARHALA